MANHDRLIELSHRVALAMERSPLQLVLAESCTAGLVAASLAAVPGASRYLCGSAVVYQDATKSAWLDVPRRTIEQFSAVSAEAALAMAAGALERTPHADLAASVTGHLGPDAPATLDGVAYIAVHRRGDAPTVRRLDLNVDGPSQPLRVARQHRAAEEVLSDITAALADTA